MKRLLLFTLTLLIIAALNGCGFHLRRDALQLEEKYPSVILPFTGSHSLHQALYRALETASIDVTETMDENLHAPRLLVISQNLGQRPLVYGEDSELRRERLTMSITFSFGFRCPQEFTLFTERDHQLNSNQHLGDNAEKIIIEREMQADIIRQLLRYLDAENFD